MGETVWQQRIRRAETLAAQHPFAGQILTFYIHLARFQQDLYRRLDQLSAGVAPAVFQEKERTSRPLPARRDAGASNPSPSNPSPSNPGSPELAELLANFPAFLAVVQKQAPIRLAQIADHLGQAPSDSWTDLLNNAWSVQDPTQHPSDPTEFLALAFLQPCAEFIRTRVPLQLEGYTHSLCPFCSRKPALAVLRPLGDGARRNLICGFCLCEWEFRRIVCPNCDEQDHAKLPVYTADEFPYIRVECCDTCHTYIKSIDLSKNGLAHPLVDELASVPLDLWAQERGYAKLHPNLLGM